MTNDLTYLSLGAGVQSTALLVMATLGMHRCPRPEIAIFADTQVEPAYVYEYLETLRRWSSLHGGPEIVTVTRGNLVNDVVSYNQGKSDAKRYSTIPTFTVGADGRASIMRRQCTKDYKILPIEREVRRRMGYAKGERVKTTARCLIGISMDEIWRAKMSRTKWVLNVYPLLNAKLNRSDCVKIVMDAGLPRPLKSACVMCPYHDDRYWLWMKESHEVEFARAVQIDLDLRDQSKGGMRNPAFCHRSLKPLGEIDFAGRVEARFGEPLFDGQANDGFNQECEGMCGV